MLARLFMPMLTVAGDQAQSLDRHRAPKGPTVEHGLRVVKGLILAVILLQRVAIPGAGISIALPLVIAGYAYLAARGLLEVHQHRALLYLLTCTACLTAALSLTLTGVPTSLNSLSLLLLMYLPAIFVARSDLRRRYVSILRFFSTVMLVASVLALAEWALQLLGLRYYDVVGGLLPKQLLVPGYNTSYPIEYGSSLYKSNGLVFLEPSFFSQFTALAVLTQIVLAERQRRIAAYLFALVTSVSGTGVFLLGVGLTVLAVRRGVWWTARLLVTAAVAVGIVATVPGLGGIFLNRSKESSTSGTSGNLRFVKPYQVLVEGITATPQSALTGFGPGSDDRYGKAYFERSGLPLGNPTLQKALFEYGLLSGMLLVFFLVYVILSGARSPTLAAALLCQHLLLSGGLLQPQTLYACLLLGPLFCSRRARTMGHHAAGSGELAAPAEGIRGLPGLVVASRRVREERGL